MVLTHDLNTGSERAKCWDFERFYFGRLCPYAHDHGSGRSLRHRSNGTCITCQAERVARYYRSAAGRATAARSKAKHRAKIMRRARAYRHRNAERIRAYNASYRKRRIEWRRAYYRRWQQERNAIKLQAMPAWTDPAKVARLHLRAERLTRQTGIKHHVDHIVPLRSKLVCGLHVQHNLRVITEARNCRKGNRRWPDMP